MLTNCNCHERDIEIDNVYSHKKKVGKEWVNKTVKCEYCNKGFDSKNLSRHIKQRNSTYDSSRTNDSTYNTSRTNDSTYNSSRTNDSTSSKRNKVIVLLIR